MTPEHILYIEDEEDYQMLVQKILGRAGLDVEIADTGAAGFAALRARRPSLLILDINLPDTTGYAICEQLRQDPAWADLPILMLTVRRRPEEWLRGFSSGANDYVSKPLNPPELVERVINCLEGKPQTFTPDANPEFLQVQAVLKGNRGAYEVLVQKYRERLRDNLLPVVKDETEAEDAVAQSFVKAYEKLDQFRGEASFYTWLYRIAMNVVFSTRAKAESISLDEVDDDSGSTRHETIAKADPLSADLADDTPAAQAMAILNHVPEPFRQMLVLYFLEEKSYETIAEELKIPVGTVMSRLFKGRKLLQETGARLSRAHAQR